MELVQTIEQKINKQLTELELPESQVMERLSAVVAAKRVASMALHDEHFGEQRERNKRKADIAAGRTKKGKRAAKAAR